MVKNNLTFKSKPIPIPADYRPMYKIGIIVLILKFCCRGEKGSLLKLHLLSWAIMNEGNMKKLEDYIESSFTMEFSIWSIEPALNRALQLAVAENICILEGKNYVLTSRGLKFFQLINENTELLNKEKNFLNYISKNKITDKRINLMSQQWLFDYVKN